MLRSACRGDLSFLMPSHKHIKGHKDGFTVATNTMLPSLPAFCAPFRTSKGQPFTHTSLGLPCGSYNIPDSEVPAFMATYKRAHAMGVPLHMSESHLPHGPVVIDLDFRQASASRCYDQAWMLDFARRLAATIAVFVDQATFSIYVLQKEAPRPHKKDPTVFKDGLHLIAPDIITVPAVQRAVRARFLQDHGTTVFAPFTNDIEDIYDDAVISRNNWLMYGSKKADDEYMWLHTHTYRHSGGVTSVHEAFDHDVDLVELFSIRKGGDLSSLTAAGHAAKLPPCKSVTVMRAAPAQKTRLHMTETDADCAAFVTLLSAVRADDYHQWMTVGWALYNTSPGLLDVWTTFSARSSKYEPGECERLWDGMQVRETGARVSMGTVRMWARQDDADGYATLVHGNTLALARNCDGSHDQVAQLASTVLSDRFVCVTNDGKHWYHFDGNLWSDDGDGLELRRALTKDLCACVAAAIHAVLCSMSADDVKTPSVASSRGGCKSPQEAEVDHLKHLHFKLRWGAVSTADCFAILGNAERVSATGASSVPPYPPKHALVTDLLFAHFFTSTIKHTFEARGMRSIPRIASRSVLGDGANASGLCAAPNRDTHYKDSVVRALREYMYDKAFMNRLDSKPQLIAFTNGVYDLATHGFRHTAPDDYVSISVGYDFVPTRDPEAAAKVRTYLEQLHPDAAQREYVLKMLARQLYGDGGHELFHVHAGHNGSAGNGKSCFFEVLEMAMGDYVRKFPVSMLTVKARGDAMRPVPEFQNWRGRRIMYCTEPDEDDKLHSGVLKELTGGEMIMYRLLWSNATLYFRPQYKMHVMCNNAPLIEGGDEGVNRRVRKIDYVSQFVPEDQVREDHHMYKLDPGFKTAFKESDGLKMEFLRMLLDNYSYGFDFCAPASVCATSREYLDENNKVKRFAEVFIVADAQAFFSLTMAKDVFKASEFYDGKLSLLKGKLERILNTKCQAQKKIANKNHTNVYLGYSLVGAGVDVL